MTSDRPARTKARYDTLSRYYDVLVDPFQGRLRRRGIECLDVSSGDCTLVVGCGTGRGAARLRTAVGPNGHVIGVDVSPQMCRLTSDRLDQTLSSVAICGDAQRLPFKTDSFDAVLVSFTIELFETDRQTVVLEEIRRVLAPGGRLCVVAPSTTGSVLVSPLYERLNDLVPRVVDSRPLAVSATLADAGFEIVQTQIEKAVILPVEIVVAR